MPLETSLLRAQEFHQTYIIDSRNAKPTVSQGSSSIQLAVINRTVNKNPNWKDEVRRQVDASTPYAANYCRVLNEGGVLSVSGTTGARFLPSYRIDTSGRYKVYGQPQLGPTSDPETRNRALKKIKDQLAGRTGSYKAMAPLAEMRELGGLVQQATLLSTNFVVAVANAKRTKGRSAINFLQDTWLGYSFALAPLIGDIADAGNSIAEYISRQDQTVRLRSTATKRGTYSYTPSTSVTAAPMGFAWERKAQGSYELSYRFIGGFELALRSSNDYSALDQFGISFGQIPATLWELTAFSWLIDYFTNVGEFLDDAFSSQAGETTYLVENRMLKCKVDHSFRLYCAKNNPNGIVPSREGFVVRQFELGQFQRTPLSALPKAAFVVKETNSVAHGSVNKLLNLLSLIK